MICYLDSSVILRKLFNHPEQSPALKKVKIAGTSELSRVECLRVIDRYRLEGQLTDEGVVKARSGLSAFFDGMTLFAISESVMDRAASSFPTVLGTLDAIHLSTAMLWRESQPKGVLLMTHDRQLARAAMALDMKVLGI